MGNCCLKGSRSSTMVWAETDDENDRWVYYSDPNLQQSLLIDEKPANSSVSIDENTNNGKNREVKIMLSKKKLEELLGKVEDLHNIPVDQILNRLIDSNDQFEFDDDYNHHHQQQQEQQPPWKPNLQSIPEE